MVIRTHRMKGFRRLEETKTKHRFVALDSWRGIAACFVVLDHCTSSPSHVTAPGVVQNAWMFVDFFFVLSGFVIGTSYGDRLKQGFSIGRFMWLRLWRVYPLYLFMLLLFLAFEIAFFIAAPYGADRRPFEGTYDPGRWLLSAFLVQIFVPRDGIGWNIPGWSIAAEVWTYLIFAFILRFLPRFITIVCIGIIICALAIIPGISDRYLFLSDNGAVLRCMLSFSFGILGWHFWPLWQKVPLGRRGIATLAEITAILAAGTLIWNGGTGPLSLGAPPVFFLVVMIFARQEGAVSRLLLTPPFVLLGTLSYSIYMVQWFLLFRYINVLSALQRFTHYPMVTSTGGGNHIGGSPWFADLAVIAFLGLVIFCALWTYRFIEEPCRKLGRRLDKEGFLRIKTAG